MCSIAGSRHAKQPSSPGEQKALKVTRADAELAAAGKDEARTSSLTGNLFPTFPLTSRPAGAALPGVKFGVHAHVWPQTSKIRGQLAGFFPNSLDL